MSRRGAAESRRTTRLSGLVALLMVVICAATGCSIHIPADPNGTLDRVTGGVLRVGASISGYLVTIRAGEPAGSEVDLIDGFATSRSSSVDWTVGSEETLVGMLESGDLDIVIGGMTGDTPWVERAGVTRGYPGIPGSDGRSLVFLVPLGENRLLSALESYLDGEVGA